MIGDQWQKAKKLYDAALKLAPNERARFIDANFADDEDVRLEVQSLLANSHDAASFLETPAIGEVAEAIAGQHERLCEGQNLGNYKIIKQLGSGGMGEVYLAEDHRLHRRVALKVLSSDVAADSDRLRRFEQEANAASALNHPNILTVHEFGFVEGLHFLATEYVDGETLREKINRGELSIAGSLDIGEQMATALLTAHAFGINHRDIKPENIMVRRDGIVKVLDFGLAKLSGQKIAASDADAKTRALVKTNPGVIMGTVSYMSPEQARGKETDARTDIFSLGVVFYEMLTGLLPFEGESMSDTISAILTKEPPPLAKYLTSVPAELQRIVRKTLQKNVDDRYQTVKDLLLDIKTLKRGLEFSEEVERSGVTVVGSQPVDSPPFQQDLRSIQNSTQLNTSSAEYIVKERKLRKFAALGIIAALMGIGAFVYFRMSNASPPIRSIAVMPFVNATQNDSNEYLSDGITENIINNLSKIPKLTVKSRNSVFYYKGKDANTRTIGNELGVASILKGDMRQLGDQIVVNVELINTSDDVQIWGRQYTNKIADIITMQNEISRELVGNLRLTLDVQASQALNKRPTQNVEAYQLFMKGRSHDAKLTRAETEKGIAFFQQAIALDPNYALAYASLSNAYRRFTLISDSSSGDVLPKSKAAALRAVEIDETLAEAHATLGVIAFWYDWDWRAADTHFRRALELDPNSANSHLSYAQYLSSIGEHENAIAEAKRAREIEPQTLVINALEGQVLFYAGKNDEAIDHLQKTIDLEPNFWLTHLIISKVYAAKGMHTEAIAAATRARELSNANSETIALVGYSLAKSGDMVGARSTLEELLKLSKEHYIPPYNIALVYNALGDTSNALALLEKGESDKDVRLTFLKVEPKWNNLRSNPRFRDLMIRMNFPE